jgi:hypothetical protein
LDISSLSLRELQTEAAKAISCIEATNNNIHRFNKLAHHDSQKWYRAVIKWYIDEYGDLPSKAGPGKNVKLILEETQND